MSAWLGLSLFLLSLLLPAVAGGLAAFYSRTYRRGYEVAALCVLGVGVAVFLLSRRTDNDLSGGIDIVGSLLVAFVASAVAMVTIPVVVQLRGR